MDIFRLLGYLNKVSLIAFVITSGLLIYQLLLLKREKTKRNNLTIPDFKDNQPVLTVNYTKLPSNLVVSGNDSDRSSNVIFMIIIVVTVIVFLFILILIKKNNSSTDNQISSPMIKFVSSKGIKVYNGNGQELSEKEINKLEQGKKIIIGIETVDDENIDKARIKINKENWTDKDITLEFDQQKKIFYRQYIISSQEAHLKIDAQLHSKVDGWLSD